MVPKNAFAVYPSQQNYIPQLSIECVIFGYRDGQLKVLVPKMAFEGDFWALPSGFVYQHESTDDAARRILADRTGLTDMYLEQFWVFSDPARSSRAFMDRMLALNEATLGGNQFKERELEWFTKRFVSVGYFALVDIDRVLPRRSELDASIDWYNWKDVPPLIMDHNEVVIKAIETLRLFLDQKLIAYHLLPETFTMKQVQQLYEAVYDHPFAANNFPKKILDQNVLERLEKKFTGAANKAPYLYRLRKSEEINL